jgi:ABC-type multidrug transport system fused ATPase/permease subunit
LLGQYWTFSMMAGNRARLGVSGAVYQKLLRLRFSGRLTVGEVRPWHRPADDCCLTLVCLAQVTNIVANDGQRVQEALGFGLFIVAALVSAVVVFIYALVDVGPFALVGVAIYFLYFPAQVSTAKMAAKLRRNGVQLTDARVRAINELLSSIKLIKL